MATRFRKTKKVGPARISVSKKSLGTSFGGKAFGFSVNSKSGVRFRSSIPGTGISYTHKLGSSKKKGVNKATKATPKSTSAIPSQPVPRRWWYISIAIVFLIGGIGNITTSIPIALFSVLVGAAMLLVTFRTPKLPKIDWQQFQRQAQIFDDSIKLICSTKNPETFFSRYKLAEETAKSMASMTTASILHDEPPQEAVAMLERDKTEVTNQFLDRFSKDIRLKAYELTRGREKKMESFILILGEYKEQMTEESIYYMENLYAEMKNSLSKVVEEK